MAGLLALRKFSSVLRKRVSIAYPVHSAPLAAQVDDYLSQEIYPVLDEVLASVARLPQLQAQMVSSSPSTAPRFLNTSTMPNVRLCELLHDKTIYLVGPPHTTYVLHSHLLHGLTPPDAPKPYCAGAAFCPYHILCVPPAAFLSALSEDMDLAPYMHTGRRASPPVGAALLRFVPSVTLDATLDRNAARFAMPRVDLRTGVRVADYPWVAPASRAEVLVLGRAAVPAPAWSYRVKNGSAWDWLEEIGRIEREMPERGAEVFGEVLGRLSNRSHEGYGAFRDTARVKTERVLRAALHSTVAVFAPSVLGVLEDVRRHAGFAPVLRNKVVLWHGGWFLPVLPGSADEEEDGRGTPRALVGRLVRAREPWSAYYNAQGGFSSSCDGMPFCC
jgi:hypothetical protein